MLACRQISSPTSSRSIACLARCYLKCNTRRSLSSSVDKDITNARVALLTALHKTTALIPRVLPPQEMIAASSREVNAPYSPDARLSPANWWQNFDSTIKSSEFWLQRLSETYDDLSSSQARPARVLVCGTDEWSASEDLVTAVLEQPFASDDTVNEFIRNRWVRREHGQLLISHAAVVSSDGSTLSVPSSFLLDFPCAVEIEEYSSKKQFNTSGKNLILSIWNADAVVVLSNPLTVPMHEVFHPRFLWKRPITIVAYTHTARMVDESSLKTWITNESKMGQSWSEVNVLFTDPSRAVIGLDALRENPASPAQVQRYQDEYLGSRISSVVDALKSSFRSINTNSSSSPLDTLQVQRVTVQLEAALNCMRGALDYARDEANRASSIASRIQEDLANEQVSLRKDILGVYDKSVPSQESHVAKALANSARQVRSSMDRLTWWRMLWRIDEVATIVSRNVEQAWCKDLEKQLVFQSGGLTQLQNRYMKESLANLKLFELSAFNSLVLQNALQQISSSPTYQITPDTLTSPLTSRRSQIVKYPTLRLHLAGQQAALGMGLSVTIGAGLGWAGWVQWLAGSGEGLLRWLAMDASTAIGLGLLVAVGGVRWGVGTWERAKKRWWEDWGRVGEGLERDLSATLDQTLEEKVGALPRKIYQDFTQLAPKRRDEIDELLHELNNIQKDIKDIH